MAKKQNKKKISPNVQNILDGRLLLKKHPLFGQLDYHADIRDLGKDNSGKARISYRNEIIYNSHVRLSPEQWAYVTAHLLLHSGLGHTNPQKVSRGIDISLWNTACDIYITKFLHDIRFKDDFYFFSLIENFEGSTKDEMSIYRYLAEHPEKAVLYQELGMYQKGYNDIFDLDEIWNTNFFRWNNPEKEFAIALQHSVKSVLQSASSQTLLPEDDTRSRKAANWFINSFPLLGSLAAHFKVIENNEYCRRNDIQIAAIDVSAKEIYVNPSCGLSDSELRFVLAHEYLHAGLDHANRIKGRDPYLWNIACDYVINAWLLEMNIGTMPENGLMYDETLKDMSAEEIYDELVRNLRIARKLMTFRGYGKGDILGNGEQQHNRVSLDEFCRNALMQGLEYHISTGRGIVPAGLMEEIRALAISPIEWDIELAIWFDDFFAPIEKHRTYARPSRRQSSTPDIPRPSYYIDDTQTEGRTFGVIIDTSGSMSPTDIGIALGAVASYSDSRDVPKARVIFCDAKAYDMGYLSPQDIAGKVEVIGRGGTVLQPAVDLLENAKDFPKNGAILIITDGYIERDLKVKREHAFLIPQGHILPFKPSGKVFYYYK